ncbi:MAG TPA: BACON domain-containing carbohydrate-binding protein, partial [Pyrinomonadaceae bacterium]|nr:BACON domain-containing carbohydrate-binding protein [Pyrinomonadaceae bacterium]
NVRHKLVFRQRYQMDYEFDGGVLELAIGAGAFTDIISAGGSFVSGSYDTPMVASTLSGRNAWTGDSVNFITTEINLPANTSNQSIRLRWRFASDNMEGGQGWWIDNIQITNAISGFNTNALTIPASGPASLYPSQISVSGQTGLVQAVQVNLTNFSHTAPDDVDLLLVGPNGNKVVLMSDVGGANAATNLNLVFDDTAAASLPDSAALASGTFKPTDFELGDAFPAPAPAGGQSSRFLSVFNGMDPNGTWSLYLVDDTGANAGSISGGWSISVISSDDVIGIQATGAANPYPSQRLVSGLLGTVTDATVTLTDLSHTAPDDVDIMLVAPNGRRIVLMSDAGGVNEVGSINLTFSDAAASQLSDSGTLTTGTFKPTDFEIGDAFPAPAPAGAPTGSTFAAFYGSAPNGFWRLYAVDDAGNNVGSIAGGWSVNLTTSTTACDYTINPPTQAFPTTGGSGTFGITMAGGCSWTAVSSSPFVSVTTAAAGDGNGSVGFSVQPNFGGPRTGTITVSNGVLSKQFQVQQPSGCPTSLNQTAVNFGASGGSGSVNVTAGGACSYLATSSAAWTQITSPTQSGNGTVTFTVAANTGSQSRSATVTVSGQTFTVNQAGASGRKFDFDADGKADLSIFRPSNGSWWGLYSGNPTSWFALPFGISTDRPVPADFDGDRKTDIAVYRDGVWYVFNSQNNSFRIESFGVAGDTPVPGDFDGDGRADLGVFRPSDGNWYLLRSATSNVQVVPFGLSTDKALVADFDGDGKSDVSVYRPGATSGAQSFWVVQRSSDSIVQTTQFGSGGDIAVPVDFDGNGRDNLAVYRPSNGTWYTSTDPATNYGAVQFGIATDVPAPSDFDGDGKVDIAIFRQGLWYIINSSNSSIRIDQWGATGDVALPSLYNSQ